MTDKGISEDFWKRADEYIAIANAQSKKESTGKVGASLLYAAARFSAFDVASKVEDAQEMKDSKDDAITFYVEQFRKMITENMDDYIESYREYNPHG
jgi:hypothetical protein